jgi:DNA-binding transcriptional regulator YdaS (Cro superfamily)
MSGLSKAIEQQGGLTCLATSLGLSKGVVFQWKVRGRVPPEYCPEIEKLTGGQVKCEELNDKVDWASLRVTSSVDQSRRKEDKLAKGVR